MLTCLHNKGPQFQMYVKTVIPNINILVSVSYSAFYVLHGHS